MSAPRVLVLAGLDPSGRAGLLADGEAIRAAGARPVLCATAIAAQSEQALLRLEPVSPAALLAQVDAALADGKVDAVKLGMLGSRALLEAAGAALRGRLAGVPAVVDPVLETSSRGALYEGSAADYLALLDRIDLLTPNLAEAALLTGRSCDSEQAMSEAARALLARGARAVLLKGGHLGGAPADLLASSGRERWFRGRRHPAPRRGTGCRLASAIAAQLAQGRALEESVERSVDWLREWIATA